MATRTFLSEEQLNQAQDQMQAFDAPVDMENLYNFPGHAKEFSEWLGQALQKRLETIPEWKLSHPIALGSWARNELCSKSDIDLLFVGEEKYVKKLVQHMQEAGLKIRSRVPQDPSDWSVGVDPFDILSMLYARPFTGEAAEKLSAQQSNIRARGQKMSKSLLTAMVAERKLRTERYDSISNFLEPNIKYGPGGLRDLQQALFIFDLYEKKFEKNCRAQRILHYYREFFLAIRQSLHMQNYGEIIVATEQESLARWCGFDSSKSFMRELSIGLKRVSFYADWIIEQAKSSQAKIDLIQKKKIKNKLSALRLIQADSGLLMQERVRASVLELFKKFTKLEKVKVGRHFQKLFSKSLREEQITALFRSRLMEFSIREIDPLIGLVQHDQYHRYSADAHILQALKETVRIRKRPGLLGKLSKEVKSLRDADWKILLWTCIYHDIAKGRPGDHAAVGAKVVAKDFKEMKLPKSLLKEVQWMVANHLLMSNAAFRQNPQSPATWRKLHEKGVKGARLRRLSIFTAIDIRATNPEAWNGWKERLLYDLINTLRSPKTDKFFQLLEGAQTKKIKLAPEFVKVLDPELVAMVPRKYLLDDFKKLKTSSADLPVLILPKQGEETWVRFHRRENRPGLFLKFVNTLHSTGCRIDEASVQTFSSFGAYDWFKIRSSKSAVQLKKLFSLIAETTPDRPEVKFNRVLLVNQDEEEAIISFRGRDQKGALVAAAQVLFESGFQIRWARVHTWGRQIDDVFCVDQVADIEKVFEKMVSEMTLVEPS